MWFTSKTITPRKITTGNYAVTINGNKIEFDQNPLMVGERVLVPLRKIFEELNADVYYDVDLFGLPYITAIKGNTQLHLSSGVNNYWTYSISVNEQQGFLKEIEDVVPMIINGRTLVPVRLISEALQANVDWNGDTQTVIITADTSETRRNNSNVLEQFTYEKAVEIMRNNGYKGNIEHAIYFPIYDLNGNKYFTLSTNYNSSTGNSEIYQVYNDGTIKSLGKQSVNND